MRAFGEFAAEVARLHGDMFGWGIEAMAEFVTHAEAAECGMLKPPAEWADGAARDWNLEVKPRTVEAIVGAVREYMVGYGFDGARHHRGLSAQRTVDKMRTLVWLLGGHDDLLAYLDDGRNYSRYGVPMLKRIAQRFDIPIPPEIVAWADGQPCKPGCVDGCAP